MRRYLTLLAVVLLPLLCRGQACFPMLDLSPDSLVFQSGEKLTFAVHYKWGPVNSTVAKGYLTSDAGDYNGTDAVKVRLYCRTSKFYNAFFKVREEFVSWLSTDGLVPLHYTRDSQEGSYYANDVYTYDWSEDPHIIATLDSKKKGQRDSLLPLNHCTFDFMSMMAHARHIDFESLEEGKAYPISYALGAKVKNISLVCEGKSTVKVDDVGKVRVWKIGLIFGSGDGVAEDSDMYIYISDDESRVPVYFAAPMKIGTVKGWLSKYEGLKKPFTAIE